jgi:protoporphyrinogen oxidase
MKYLDSPPPSNSSTSGFGPGKTAPSPIYEAVNKKLAHPAILNTEVTKVERPEGGKVKVTLKDKEGEKVEEFDKLIVTTPLDQLR